jgi:putative heme iron utilization protein
MEQEKKENPHRSSYNPREGHTLPTHGDYARTLAKASKQGVLATLDKEDGTPYASIVELLPLDDGSFVFFCSSMAEHTKNMRRDPRASLLIADGFGKGYALALSRATFIGKIQPANDQKDTYRQPYLEIHPEAAAYIDFPDFAFFRLHVERVRYIGGFGRMSWVEEEAYAQAAPDPLWRAADRIIEHMNEDHQHNLRDYARTFGKITADIQSIEMTCLDRFGFEMRAQHSGKGETLRISFPHEIREPKAIRTVLVEMAEEARQSLSKQGLEPSPKRQDNTHKH